MTEKKRRSKGSLLFRTIEEEQGNLPWGNVLDAGAGVNSIEWLAGLTTDSITGVTGSKVEKRIMLNQHPDILRKQDTITVGNWSDVDFMSNQRFDTVIADYLLGAIDGFAPFFQSYLFKRLRPLTLKRLYITGLEPYVPVSRPKSPAGQIIWEIGRLRDACVLLSGANPYREYPALWVSDQLQSSGFEVISVKHFKTGLKRLFVDAQINIALSSIQNLKDPDLVNLLSKRAQNLRKRALEIIKEEGALRHCRNYLISAETR
ncbi:MAG: class I SAM-dependent methyltransferase [Gammaproteobacteria bacterium]|nr:class I SAM-dependent methyltransferase [Gammaproteobacteria bacterium]